MGNEAMLYRMWHTWQLKVRWTWRLEKKTFKILQNMENEIINTWWDADEKWEQVSVFQSWVCSFVGYCRARVKVGDECVWGTIRLEAWSLQELPLECSSMQAECNHAKQHLKFAVSPLMYSFTRRDSYQLGSLRGYSLLPPEYIPKKEQTFL